MMAGVFLLSSCVAKRYLTQSQNEVAALRADSTQMAKTNASLQANINSLKDQIVTLENTINDLHGKISALTTQNRQLGQQTVEQQNKITQSQRDLRAEQN